MLITLKVQHIYWRKDALYSKRIDTLDINFFSLAFLYRHSIELILKSIGFQYIKEDKESDSFRYPFSIIKKKTDIFNLDKKEFCIKEFFDKQIHINLLNFANKMEIIFDILNSYYLKKDNINGMYKDYRPIFLEEGGNYYSQSVIGYGYNRKSFYYNIQSYRNSAKVLYNHSSENLEQRNLLFMPMCYLYRNSIELSMKDILFDELSYTYQEALKLLNYNKHKLFSIWKLIKSDIIKYCDVSKDDKVICDLEQYIVKLNDIDGAADKFRYPTNKNLDVYFKRVRSFDVDNVKDFFEDIL